MLFRSAEGIVADLSVAENLMLGIQARRGSMRRIPRAEAESIVVDYIQALGVRPADPGMRAGNLSGGNQQKVLLARWLATAPALLVLDEPTRGIDVGAKSEIFALIDRLAGEGLAVVMMTSEMPELLGLSDRILVMAGGRVTAEMAREGATQEGVLNAAVL